MADKKKKFHEFALKSNLFKGRNDWYFCFLKAERLSHVLWVLTQHASLKQREALAMLADESSLIPKTILGVAGGEQEVRYVLGNIFSILFSIRILHTQGAISRETARVLIEEYEALAEKLDAGERVSPFVSPEDFMIPPFGEEPTAPHAVSELPDLALDAAPIKDKTSKGHKVQTKGQQDRSLQILNFVFQNKGVTVKDIAAVVRGCSEKTIQRELNELIRLGRIQKVGERRWSMYKPTSEPL
jgi:hypothetical protein